MGLNLVGPFKKAKGGFTHTFITVDKFTKWIEVKPAALITVAKALKVTQGNREKSQRLSNTIPILPWT
jgi:hypothetical protein